MVFDTVFVRVLVMMLEIVFVRVFVTVFDIVDKVVSVRVRVEPATVVVTVLPQFAGDCAY